MNAFSRVSVAASLAAVTTAFTMAVARPVAAFPPSTLRFWADDGLVLGLMAVTLLAIAGGVKKHEPTLAFCISVPAGALLGACVFGSQMFPAAKGSAWGMLFGCALLWMVPSLRLMRRHSLTIAGLIVGAAGGTLHLSVKRPGPALTHPMGTWPLPASGITEKTVTLPCGSASIEMVPTLQFQSTSRDGFWPGLSEIDDLQGEPPLEGPQRRAVIQETGDGLDVMTQVPHEVASHLNRFTDVFVKNVKVPRIRFDGANVVHEFLPFDYPKGRPAQFAYYSKGELVVARGTDAEKGPFVELARGKSAELSFTLFDGDVALCSLSFPDFVSQADVTSVSPTAGEGVPPNVIQFGIPAKGAPVPVVHLSLAETGIGSGLETVKHAAGVYRNRIRVTPSVPLEP